jgi:hypothetical protein
MSFTNHPLPYSDYLSLKKYLEGQYGTKALNVHTIFRTQTGTAGAVELSEKAAATITAIGKTEIAVQCSITNGDDANYDGETCTLVYMDSDGEEHTAVCTMTATMHTTAVAFSPAIADFYCAISCTSSIAIIAGDTLICHTTGDEAVIWAQITAAATTSTAAELHGVGEIYGRTEANHNDGDGIVEYLEYMTPWGEIKHAQCTVNTTDGTTETHFYECTVAWNERTRAYTYTVGTVQVVDYYRTRNFFVTQAGTANTHAIMITDADCANVDGSGGDVYGMIEELLYRSIHTRFMAPGSTYGALYLGKIKITNSTAAAVLAITFTPKNGKQLTVNYNVPVGADMIIDLPCGSEALEPESDCSMTILGNTAVLNAEVTYLEYYNAYEETITP